MNAIHWHLLLTHIPILGTLFGTLLFAVGFFIHSKEIHKAGLATLVIVSLLSIPTKLTGEEAEHKVEEYPGVSEHFLEEHEELAEKAVPLVLIMGAVSLFALYGLHTGKFTARWISGVVLVLALASFAMLALVGGHGGKIMHEEIRTTQSVEDSH
jgi:hypothetical protein